MQQATAIPPSRSDQLSQSDHPAIRAEAVETIQLPLDSWDCHVHVFERSDEFPFSRTRTFTPGEASLDSLRQFRQDLGLCHSVLVQASVYGQDNRLILDVLEREEGVCRGIAVIDPSTGFHELSRMHAAGIRGVRLNLETFGRSDPSKVEDDMRGLSDLIAPLGWHIQVYCSAAMLAALADVLPNLACPVVIDHFGGIDASAGVEDDNTRALLDLVRTGRIWLKLSAPSRVSAQRRHFDLEPIVKRLVEARPDRLIWGSDWPHTGGHSNAERRPDRIEPFKAINDFENAQTLARWLSAEEIKAVWVDNPAMLYA